MVNIKFKIVVVGSGGTGTYFLKEFSRFLCGNEQAKRMISNMVIFDGDTVEEKNIQRQAFTSDDIGLHKAAVIAGALNDNFGLEWNAKRIYVTKTSQLEEFGYTERMAFGDEQIIYREIPLIIGCVDNHACRLVLEDFFNKNKYCIMLDSANEYSTGEVVFSSRVEGKTISPLRSHWFPDIIKGDLRHVTDMSCEELNNASPQHIATNMMAGNILLTEVCAILNGNFHAGFVSFDTHGFYMEFNEYKELASKKGE